MHVETVDLRSRGAPGRVAESLRATGFVVLAHHPVDPELVAEAHAAWQAWFAGEEKWTLVVEPGHQDGYHPMSGSETAVGASAPDIKEFFHWYPWGRHPAGPGGPSEVAAALHAAAGRLGTEVLAWLAAALPAPVAARLRVPLPEMLDGSSRNLLRLLHYPPLRGDEPAGATRAAAHEDINLLTVLPAASRPGLQVRDQAGRWHDVAADPGTVVVNAGDMLALATGGHHPSTTHRVVVPGGEERRSRLSAPLFLQPADDVELADGVTAFEMLRQRLREIRGIDLQR